MRILALLLVVWTPTAHLTHAFSAISGAQAVEPTLMRVRSTGDPTITQLLHDASERSATFRQLIESINHTNDLVYVDPGKCKPGFAACLLMSVKLSGPNRMLRIVVDTHREPRDVMSSIGHELQHAIEALSEPGVTSNSLLEMFFERKGGSPAATGQLEFETDAAIKAGDAVLKEVSDWINRAGK